MEVSIIILNYKSKGLIRQQLSNIKLSELPFEAELVVVDNDSRDGIGEMIATDFPDARFIQSPKNRGYGSGNNIGIAQTSGKYVMIINPDIVFSADAVTGLYDFMEKDENVGVAGPKIMNADGSVQYSCVRFPDRWLPLIRRTAFANTEWGKKWLDHYFMKEWDHSSARDVDWLFGSFLIVRRSALEKVGPFDEGFFMYLEDTDWCRRFWENKYSVYYVPSVSVIHLLGRSSKVSLFSALANKSARNHLKSFLRYLYKYRGKNNPHSAAKLPPFGQEPLL